MAPSRALRRGALPTMPRDRPKHLATQRRRQTDRPPMWTGLPPIRDATGALRWGLNSHRTPQVRTVDALGMYHIKVKQFRSIHAQLKRDGALDESSV